MKVWTVTVFESGDGTTTVWGVYFNEDEANAYKEKLMNDPENFENGYYLEAKVEGHEVQGTPVGKI